MFTYVYDRISSNEDFEFDEKFNNTKLKSYYRLYTHLDKFTRDMIDLTEFQIKKRTGKH